MKVIQQVMFPILRIKISKVQSMSSDTKIIIVAAMISMIVTTKIQMLNPSPQYNDVLGGAAFGR
jgi:hypothetical protein